MWNDVGMNIRENCDLTLRFPAQRHLFSYFSPEERVPKTHPLRTIKRYADRALASLQSTFEPSSGWS